MREDELTRVLETGTVAVAQAVRPRPPESVRARGDQRRRHKRLGSALLALAVVAAGGGAYAGMHAGSGPSKPLLVAPPVVQPTQARPSGPQMLPSGKVGARAQVPWPIVGSGWSLTEFSTGTVDEAGNWQQGGGTLTLSLVDPNGGRYVLYQQANKGQPWTLLATTANGREALAGLGQADAQGAYPRYEVITATTGSAGTFVMPAGAVPDGFVQPDGTSIIAERVVGPDRELQRYGLDGHLQAILAYWPTKLGEAAASRYCGLSCDAISSPDGRSVVWNTGGGFLTIATNGRGLPADLNVPVMDNQHELNEPGVGAAERVSCRPLRWSNSQTVLIWCGDPGSTQGPWLTTITGNQLTQLARPGSVPSGNRAGAGAWEIGNVIYVNRTTGTTPATSCRLAAGDPADSGFEWVGQNGADTPVLVPGSTTAQVVGAAGDRLLVQATTSCPGGGGLLWLSTGTTRVAVSWLQRSASGQAGVVAVTPLGS